MTNPYKKVKPGDNLDFSASLYNTLGDMAYAYRNSGRVGDPAITFKTTIKVLNYTNQDLKFGDAIGVEEQLFGVPQPNATVNENYRHFKDRNYIAVIPREGLRLGITSEPIPKGKVGKVFLTGVVRAEVNVTDMSHKMVTFEENSVKLKSSDDGDLSFLIQPTSIGKQWCDLVFGGKSSPGKSMVKDVLAETLAYNQTARTQGGRTVKCPELELTYSYLPTGKTVYLMPVDGDPQVEWYVVWASNLNLGIKLGPPNFTYTEPNTWTAKADTYLAGAGTSYAEDLGLAVNILLGPYNAKVASGWPTATYTFNPNSITNGNISAQISSTKTDIENSDLVTHTIMPITATPAPGTTNNPTQIYTDEKITLVPESLSGVNIYYRWDDEATYKLYNTTTKITPKPDGSSSRTLWVGSQSTNINPQWIRDARSIGNYKAVERETEP